MVDRRYSGRYTKDCVVVHFPSVWNHTPVAGTMRSAVRYRSLSATRSLAISETSEMSRSGSTGLGEAEEMPSAQDVVENLVVVAFGISVGL